MSMRGGGLCADVSLLPLFSSPLTPSVDRIKLTRSLPTALLLLRHLRRLLVP